MSLTPFRPNYTVTQRFGDNPAIYHPLGFLGHEGVDFVPNPPNATDVFCVEGGTVIESVNAVPPAGTPNADYGIHVVIRTAQTRRTWWYCHLSQDAVALNQAVNAGDKIGVMGSTGNVTGPHLHLGLRLVDAAGNPINTNNGYKGFIDPLPVLPAVGAPDPGALTNAVMSAARTQPWMAVFDGSALYKFAKQHGLEDQETNEIRFGYAGATYVTQVFALGIVYTKDGDWANIQIYPANSVPGAGAGLINAVVAAAHSQAWMAVNDQAALYKFAKQHGLEDQQTTEIPFVFNGYQYLAQVFNKGIVYAKVNEWGNAQIIPK